jgi:hypothetical protein
LRIRIYGTPNNVSRREVCKALRYYAEYLMSDGLLETLTIRLDFRRLRGFKADLAWTDRRERPKRFRMNVHENLSREKVLESLAHEMVHVKQYATGQMMEYATDAEFVRWENEAWESDVDDTGDVCSDEKYWFSPWELEARSLERGLFKTFELHHKK